MNQVVKDEELLDISKDYFQFVAKFFEVINVSASHIYHSALELCPMSSIVRKLYYSRRITHLPKVVIGAPDSWDPTIAISGKDRYDGPCIWSPCGQFIAVQTEKTVGIRDQLTLELIAILQPTKTIRYLTGPLAYSPDGRSIACGSDTAIIIWDIQTGGVAKEIKRSTRSISLVWSSDGQTLCAIGLIGWKTFVVHIHDAPSGTTLPSGTFQSRDKPHLWTYEGSFRVMTTVLGAYRDNTIDIFKVGPTLTKIQSFTFPLLERPEAIVRSFSPTTHHLSISHGQELHIWDIRDSKRLLNTTAQSVFHCFSSDGSLFAASQEHSVYVWKHASGYYTQLGELQCPNLHSSPLQFSPTPSSIAGHYKDILRVWYLHEFSLAPRNRGQRLVGLSRSGTRAATARNQGNTITIVDLLAQTPPQFIDVGTKIDGLVITGNVLLVQSFGKVVAWLLTEEGLVEGVVGDRRVGWGDSIWTVLHLKYPYRFRVEDHVGVIEHNASGADSPLHAYHTETGEVHYPTRTIRHSNIDWHYFAEAHRGRDYLCYHDLYQCDTITSPEESWRFSRATLREGWVKDPEGNHRLWVPPEWRTDWDPADWRDDVTIQFSVIGGRQVLIKF